MLPKHFYCLFAIIAVEYAHFYRLQEPVKKIFSENHAQLKESNNYLIFVKVFCHLWYMPIDITFVVKL